MGKQPAPPRFAENQAGATAKYVRVPPRKARLVIDAIRGMYASEALAVLKFVPNFAARAIEKVIKSAIANAENGRPFSEETGRPLPALNTDNLKLVRAYVNEGPRLKRIQPRAQGRAFRILKRMCHITVVLEEAPPKPRPVRRQGTARRGQPASARPAVASPSAEAAPAPPVQTDSAVTPAEMTAQTTEGTIEAETSPADELANQKAEETKSE
jgi:large subunit ribosomal protein L22